MASGKIVKVTQVLSNSPRAILAYVFGGVFIASAILITIITFSTTNEVLDQYDAIAVWQNNNEGNWDIAYSIYKQNSNSWIKEPDADIYYEGDANLIAKLPGNDNDPDIASTKQTAMAVWSNTGMEGNQGADIFLANWDASGWKEPTRLFVLRGDDIDPTIYMQDQNNALVVWINSVGPLKKLYYTEFTRGNWSDPQPIDFSAEDISNPELGYMTVRGSRYLLAFTAKVEGGSFAYTATYARANGWEVTKIDKQGAEAIVDADIPAQNRTSVSMNVETKNVAAGWSGRDGNIWYMEASPAESGINASLLESGVNPVVLHNPNDANGGNTLIYAVADKLINQTPIGGTQKQEISIGEPNTVRPDATYLIEQGNRSIVAVWSTKKEGMSEVYFSSVDTGSQQWSAPNRIDSKVFAGEDINPAIAPILIQFEEEKKVIEEEDFVIELNECGDGVLDGFEECEIGVACVNKNEVCDWNYYNKKFGAFGAVAFSDCECLSQDGDLFPPVTTPKGNDDTPRGKSVVGNSETVYGGASCGFDSVVLKSAIGTGQVSLQFLPDTTPTGNGTVAFSGGYPNYQVDKFILFPESGLVENARLVLVDFSSNDNVITMTGIDSATGFQLCTGIFTKGEKPERGGLVPASAPSGNTAIPDLPPEVY